MLTVSVGFGQSSGWTPSYQLNYPKIKFGNSAINEHQMNGLFYFLNKVNLHDVYILGNTEFKTDQTIRWNNPALYGKILGVDGSGYFGAIDIPSSPVTSVNGRTGAVTGLAELNVDNNFSGNQLIVGNQDITGYQKITGSSEINGPLVLKDVFSLQRNGNILIEGNVNSLGENISVGSLALSYQNLSNRSTVFIKPSFSTNQTINLDLPTAGGTFARLEDITVAGDSYELLANKSTTLASPNNTTYPTTLAVSDAIAGITPVAPTFQQVLTAGATATVEPVIQRSGSNLTLGLSGGGGANGFTIRGTGRDWYHFVQTNGNYTFGANQGDKYFFTNDGKLGINQSTPTEALHVVGKALVSVAPTDLNGVARLTELNGKTNLNGSNATGTWPISVTGNSETTTKWGGIESDFTVFGVNLFGFLAYNEFGMGRAYSVAQVKSALGVATQARYTASGNGSSTAIVIPHGLTGITSTSSVIAFANSSAATGITFATIDATNVTVNYTVAPASGTNNLIYTISIK